MTSIPPFLAKIDSLQQQIADHGDWDEEVRKRIAYKFRLDWNYHSQSIEGGTLTRRETRTIMVGQVDVHGKPLKDVLEMTQHNEVIQEIMAVGKGQKRLSESRIRQIHGAIMHEEDPVKRKLLGTWKTQPNEIFNHKGEKFDFTAPLDVSDEIHDLLNRTNANWDQLERGEKDARHAVLMALDFHLEFLSIHPFYDGNGRTARILLNLILISFGYLAIIVKNEDKEAYGRYIAEIQGYGAGRELYYEFMSGLLTRSQELVLQGLAGEEIDEPDDLFKEIDLFQKEQEAKAGGLEPVLYSQELFHEVLPKNIVPFLIELRERTQIFDRSFFYRQNSDAFFLKTMDTEGMTIPIRFIIPWKYGEEFPVSFFREKTAQNSADLEIVIYWSDYKHLPQNAFGIHFKLDIRFARSYVEIVIDIQNQLTESYRFPYALLLRDGLPQEDLIRGVISAIFEEIKKQTDRA